MKLLLRVYMGLFLLCVVQAYAQQAKPSIQLAEKDRIFVFEQPIDLRAINVEKVSGKEEKRSMGSNIIYVVRMPRSWNPDDDKKARSSGKPSVRGVIAFSAHNTKEQLVDEMTKEAGFHHLILLADKHNMAVVTWSNIGGFSNERSGDELGKEELRKSSQRMDVIVDEWEKGYRRFLNMYNLPKSDAMIFGISAGAQVAHRIVLRKPQYFGGIFIHVNSSYDVPTKSASKVLWFVSTGELEYGYPAAERFYKQLLDLGYCVIFKPVENIGHISSPKVKQLCELFFEYLITFIPDPTDPNWKNPPVDRYYMMRYPIYVGDYLNQAVYPIKTAEKEVSDRKYMVALPTKGIAQAWGEIIEE